VAPKIDGQISEAAWQSAPMVTDFIQNFPSYGLPASAKTEARILYDDDAVYISAYLFDDPSLIRRQLTSRDGEQRQDVDYFSVFFDTYNDEQNGFQFLVTTANVQSDAKLGGNTSTDFGEYGDKTWDAVWQSKTTIQKDGWIVEMRIPYISLRFAKKDVQTWGLQFLRSIRRSNETSFWSPVDPNTSGFVNQFGKFTELKDIQPPLRLSFSPYLSGGVRYNPEGSAKKTEWLRSGGMDVKYGINESFTLDATLIPDFGQVISDDLVNNLTPFETYFQENRQFFTEGTELFSKSGLFYSRRIGARPMGYNRIEGLYGSDVKYEIIKNPSVTKLYNAIKLSGRTEKKLGIGIFNAVAAPGDAIIRNKFTKQDSVIRTEPLTNYNIVVVDKAFKGRSSVTFTNTNVIRDAAARDANVSALNWALYNTKNTHVISGNIKYNKIFGNTPYNSSYFFNTDTTTIGGHRFLKPYDGFASRLHFGKVSGKIQYFASAFLESDKYDINDLGFLSAPNKVTYRAGIGYSQFEPTKNFITYKYDFVILNTYLYKPYTFSQIEMYAVGLWVFKNFWDVTLSTGVVPVWQKDFFELRSKDYLLKKPWFYYINVQGSTDSRKRWFVNYEFAMAEGGDIKNNPFFKTEVGLRYRFSNRFTLNVGADRQHEKLQIGNAFLKESNGEPIIGYRSNKDFTTVLSGIYNFNSRMNLSVRTRHYWNTVNYKRFYNVDAKGNHLPRTFIPDQDENYNVFNVDAFFTWDFKPGSRIVAGWKNFLGNDYSFDINGIKNNNYSRNFRQTFALPHGNELSLRIIYFLDYNQLRCKR
ncbi:MAG: carbohydrate binding family 9 domain-containing protein, partial [Bacteroidota bacterium]|nr:carbohydrate binding family 9 domain-containing protein [Bacteroidota bacterium]